MQKMIKFPSIEQYRNFIQTVKRQLTFDGYDENGEAKYSAKKLPVLTLKGTVKLHGTNAGVSKFNGDIWAQSRENIITPLKDNMGFAFFVESNKESFENLFSQIESKFDIDSTKLAITIFGEWAGGNIQKGVGVSNLPKSFFIFDIKVSDLETNTVAWYSIEGLRDTEKRIYNIEDYQTYSIDVDMNAPEMIQNELSDLTIKVEDECPVAKAFGFEGIGEGIVWSVMLDGIKHRFKVKGEKHSSSKVKTLANVDVEKLQNVASFVEYAVTESRLEQGLQITFPDGQLDIKKVGDFIRWIHNDILKEELDTLTKNGLEPKAIGSPVATKARMWFLEKYNSQKM